MPYRSFLADIPANLGRTVMKSFKVEGRATRTEVLTYIFIGAWIAQFLGFLAALLLGHDDVQGLALASSVTTIIHAIPLPALFARRLHDVDWSGWYALIVPVAMIAGSLSPNAQPEIVWVEKLDHGVASIFASMTVLAGILVMLATALAPATDKINRYGPNPRYDEDEAETAAGADA